MNEVFRNCFSPEEDDGSHRYASAGTGFGRGPQAGHPKAVMPLPGEKAFILRG